MGKDIIQWSHCGVDRNSLSAIPVCESDEVSVWSERIACVVLTAMIEVRSFRVYAIHMWVSFVRVELEYLNTIRNGR